MPEINPPYVMGSSLLTVYGMGSSLLTVFPMGSPPSGAFVNPSSLTGLVGWYDASKIAGVSSGASLSAWTDLSGNGNHALQSSAQSQPSYQTSVIGNLPGVQFPAGSGLTAFFTLNFPFAIVLVGKTNTFGRFWNNAGGGGLLGSASATSFQLSGNAAGNVLCGGDASAHLLTAFYNSTATIRVDGNSTVSSGAITASNATTIVLGANANFGGGATVNLSEVAIYNRVLSPSETTQVESYFSLKYGITTT